MTFASLSVFSFALQPIRDVKHVGDCPARGKGVSTPLAVTIATRCRYQIADASVSTIPAHRAMHPAMKTFALLAIVAIVGVSADDDHPFTEPQVTGKTAFLETFSKGLGTWIAAKDDKYNGGCK